MSIIDDQEFQNLLACNIQCEFFSQLQQGLLDKKIFDAYLTQDNIYLSHYKKALYRAANHAPKPHIRDLFFEAANSIQYEISAKIKSDGDSIVNRATKDYIHYLHTYTSIDFICAICAIFPCYYVYYAIAKRLDSIDSSHPYLEWFQCYQSDLFVTQTVFIQSYLDEYLQRYDNSNEYIAIVNQGVLLELNFHQALMASASLGAT